MIATFELQDETQKPVQRENLHATDNFRQRPPPVDFLH
jgi:hypothetical protein